jgi:predicted alpha/beta hydrolase family esterase
VRFLVVPGWQSSGPDHWQTHLEASLDGASRVEMTDWITPKTADWIDALEHAIADCEQPPIVIAHSLGCIAAAHVSARGRVAIAGALLVAPADLERASCSPALRNFAPPPRVAFTCPTVVVASDDDPHASLETTRSLADAWAAKLIVMRGAGHINAQSGFGPWPQARVLAETLTRA